MRALVVVWLVGCAGARPAVAPPKPTASAPTREACERAVSASFAEKGGRWQDLAEEDRERMIGDCLAEGQIAQP